VLNDDVDRAVGELAGIVENTLRSIAVSD
jgi:hypothetical protein